jgi:hypothetical protein
MYNEHMKIEKKALIKLLGGTAEKAAHKLGYTHRNNIQRLSDPLTDNQVKTITMRMRAARVKIPAEWQG